MVRQPSKEPPENYESQIKLFCCILKSAVRDFVAYVSETAITDDRERLVDNYLRDIRRIAAEYRDLRNMIQVPGLAKCTANIYLFGDEYISLLIEDYTYHLVEELLGRGAGLSQEKQKELLAMLFATTVAFVSQSIYGNLTLPFFVALVVSYIFKDRIKDLLRFYLSRNMTRSIFDYKTQLYNVTRHVVGVCRESFEFIRKQKLAPEIREIRDSDHITEIENGWVGEQTFLYRKRIRFHPDWKGSIFSEYEIDGVNDIMRFNIQDFLRKMDDPNKELFVMNDEGYHRVTGTRVYHINLIIKLIGNKHQSYTRYRVILNRKGIKRIEKVRTI